MFIHTHSSAPNMFAKFGWKRFATKSGKSDCQTQVRQTIAVSMQAGPRVSILATHLEKVKNTSTQCENAWYLGPGISRNVQLFTL